MEFFPSTIAEAAQEMASGQTSCTAVIARCLAQIAKTNGKINAFLYVNNELALRRAAELDSLPAAEKAKLKLFGIPVNGLNVAERFRGIQCKKVDI